MKLTFGGFVLALLLAFDQLGNVLLLGGDPDMTMSTNCGMRIDANDDSRMTRWFCRPVCRVLNLIDDDHCHQAKE